MLGKRRQDDDPERNADQADRDLEQREGVVECGDRPDPEPRRDRGHDDEGDLAGSEAKRPRAHQLERLTRLRVRELDPRLVAEPLGSERRKLDEQMAERPRDDADREARHSER